MKLSSALCGDRNNTRGLAKTVTLSQQNRRFPIPPHPAPEYLLIPIHPDVSWGASRCGKKQPSVCAVSVMVISLTALRHNLLRATKPKIPS